MTNEQREALLAGNPTKEAVEAFCKRRWANYGEIVHPNLVQDHIEPAIQAAFDIILPLHRELVLESAQKWQPIESAPKNTFILGFFPDASPKFSVLICSKLVSDDSGDFLDWYSLDDGEQLYVEPTHWMPIPAPPETGDK